MTKRLITAVKKELPKFNDFLLKGYREKSINSSLEFISEMFVEATKVLNSGGKIASYLGYRVFTPEERATFEIEEGIIKNSVNIRSNELLLVGFDFQYKDQIFTMSLYIPYLYNEFIVLENTKYSVNFSIVEKLFSKIKDGISTKVIRTPLKFKNGLLYTFYDIDECEYMESILTSKIHKKDRTLKKNDIKQCIIHCLLAKFGSDKTLNMFGFQNDDIVFTNIVGDDSNVEYKYFPLKKSVKNQIYVKMRMPLLNNILARRLLANILYILNGFQKHQIEELNSPNNKVLFMILLGKAIYGKGNTSIPMLLQYMTSHFNSIDHYLDFTLRNRFAINGIPISNIYDLFVYIFINIDKIMIENANNDLYKKRIDIFQNALVKTIMGNIYKKFYSFGNHNVTNRDKHIKNLFKVSSKMVNKIYDMSNIRFASSLYNDNWLISIGSKATKMFNMPSSQLDGNQKPKKGGNTSPSITYSQFHPSFAVIESLIDFSSNMEASSVINPFAEIDEDGGFIKPEWAEELDMIKKHLSN